MAIKDLLNKPFQGELQEGMHEATLAKWEHIVPNTSTAEDYIAITLCTNGITVVKNLFEKDFSIFLSQIRRQFGASSVTIGNVPSFLNELVQTKRKFNIWVDYVVVKSQRTTSGIRRIQNVNYIEPLTLPVQAVQQPTQAPTPSQAPSQNNLDDIEDVFDGDTF